jgi:hypothetical protein
LEAPLINTWFITRPLHDGGGLAPLAAAAATTAPTSIMFRMVYITHDLRAILGGKKWATNKTEKLNIYVVLNT